MDFTDHIYLDSAAATPVDERVLEAMLPYMTTQFANPSAPYAFARQARTAVEDARVRIAHLIGAKPANVIFTAGATEANNLALTAAAPDATVLASAIEHPSVFVYPNVSTIPVTAEGFVDPKMLEDAITPETELVSIALANGEIGTIQPLRELGRVISEKRARRLKEGNARPLYLHTDTSQAACLGMINVSSLGADLITISASKMYGPKQVGMLWVRNGIELSPIVYGGGQESGLRSGTENVAGIIGFARAFELSRELREEDALRLAALRDAMQEKLVEAYPWAVISGPSRRERRMHNLLHISFPGIEARRLVIMLDQKNISVGTGSACAASKMQTSHVLDAIGAPAEVSAGSLRISLPRSLSEEQMLKATEAIIDVVGQECNRLHIHAEGLS